MSTPTPRTDAASALTSQHRHDDLFGDPEFGWVTVGFARTLERELAAERARLNWLEDSSVCYHVCIGRQPDGRSIHNSPPSPGSVRAAIDAAMKKSTP